MLRRIAGINTLQVAGLLVESCTYAFPSTIGCLGSTTGQFVLNGHVWELLLLNKSVCAKSCPECREGGSVQGEIIESNNGISPGSPRYFMSGLQSQATLCAQR